MANVVVLAGGDSDEREISLLSGEAVANALRGTGHSITMIDPRDGLKEQLPIISAADVVFPALHGNGGEDGVVQSFLEKNDVPFVGSSSQASELCFDKNKYAEFLVQKDIETPVTKLVDKISFDHSELIKKPFVLKPNDGGSSIDTFIVRDIDAIDTQAIEEVFDRHDTLLLQELIEGVEITVAVLGDMPLAVVEIVPPQGGEFDYENKYNGRTQELCPPVHVTPAVQQTAQLLAKKIHQLTDCRDMSRTDIIITKSLQLYVLETNTIPGLTDQSLLPRAAAQASLTMPSLCNQLVQVALTRI